MLDVRTHAGLLDFAEPRIMGIINMTPDSFYASSRSASGEEAARRAERMLAEGASIIDIGACSTRPGADEVSAAEEMERLEPALDAIRTLLPDAVLSVDTWRAEVADRCIDRYGVDIINDVSGGTLDPAIQDVVAERHAAYVLMHMRGTPATMSGGLTDYADVTAEVLEDLARKLDVLRLKGVADVIIDPGFGFAKTLEQNYRLLADLRVLRELGQPLLVGVSRKSMITRVLDTTPDDGATGTTVLDTVALMHGADIVRVHDVRPAAETIKLLRMLPGFGAESD